MTRPEAPNQTPYHGGYQKAFHGFFYSVGNRRARSPAPIPRSISESPSLADSKWTVASRSSDLIAFCLLLRGAVYPPLPA